MGCLPLCRGLPINSIERIFRQAAIGLIITLVAACSIPSDLGGPAEYQSFNNQSSVTPGLDQGDNPGPQVTSQVLSNPTEQSPTQTPTINLTPFDPISVRAADCNYGGKFKTIIAIDRYNVRFELCEPDVAFLSKVAFPAFGIQPSEWFSQVVDDPELLIGQGVVGSGPYRVVAWQPGEQLVFNSFDGYWGGVQPGSRELIFKWNIDEISRLLDLQAGVVDGVDNISPFDYSTVVADPTLKLVPRSPLSTSYLGINNTSSPFDDARVRQAIAMSIDRAAIVESSFNGGFEVAHYFTPCVVPNGCVGQPWYSYDPQGAVALMAEAGYPDGFQTVLTYRDVARGYLPRPGEVAKTIKEQLWDNLAVKVNLEVMESKAFLQAVDEGKLSGLYLLGWGADYPDVSNFLDNHFGSRASQQFGAKNPELVDLLDQGRKVFLDEARKPFYQQANDKLRQEALAIPIAYGGWYTPESLAVAYRDVVVNSHSSPFGFENFSTMHVPGQEKFVWVQGAEPLSLYCAQETDSDSLRACSQILETLYRYEHGGVTLQPGLAEFCAPSEDLTVWDCQLRKGVSFHDGSILDANDVVMSFWVQWDASLAFHQLINGSFHYFQEYWGNLLNDGAP